MERVPMPVAKQASIECESNPGNKLNAKQGDYYGLHITTTSLSVQCLGAAH